MLLWIRGAKEKDIIFESFQLWLAIAIVLRMQTVRANKLVSVVNAKMLVTRQHHAENMLIAQSLTHYHYEQLFVNVMLAISVTLRSLVDYVSLRAFICCTQMYFYIISNIC